MPAPSEHRYKADLRACRRISSPLRITVHAVASQALRKNNKTEKLRAVVTVQARGGCGYRK